MRDIFTMGKVILRAAQIIGGLTSLIFGGAFLLIGIGELFAEDPGGSDPQAFYIELLPNLILIYSAIIWFIVFNIKKKYKIGGIGLIGFGIALFCSIILTKFILTQDFRESFRAGSIGGAMYGPPFIISGILYLIAANANKNTEEK